MEYIDNKLCASYNDLIPAIMTADAIKWHRRKGALKQVQRGCNGREALFEVNSLPFNYRKEVYVHFPQFDPERRATDEAYTLPIDGAAYDFYRSYTLSDGKHLPEEAAMEYTVNASILNLFTQMIDSSRNYRSKGSGKRLCVTDFWKDKAENLDLYAGGKVHSLPTSFRKLQAKYKAYQQQGYEALISRHYSNNRASKMKTKEQEAVLVRLIGDHRNWDNARIAQLYNMVVGRIGDSGWRAITARTVANVRDKFGLITTASRRGANAFYNEKAMQVKRTAPSAPLLFWSADGWDVELYYQQTTENKKGHKTTTYTNRLTVVVVLDAFNKYPIGFAVGEHESPALIKEALRDAINHTKELFGERYKAVQFQSDRYGLKTLLPTYAAISKTVTPARVHNAKAKPVEPYFNYLNRNYCQLLDNWSGFGITSDKDKQPNIDYQNLIKKDFPDREGVTRQIIGIITAERAMKRAAFMEGFAGLKTEYRLPMPTEQYLMTFGETTKRPVAIEGCGLRPTIEGVKRDYDCFDAKFREYGYKKWVVRYDRDDLSEVLAESEDGTLRFMLESKYLQPMALADRKAGDAEQLARIQRYNAQLENSVIERYGIACTTTQQVFLENPNLHNTLVKSLISDSDGQHKNLRNAERHRIEQDDAVCAEPTKTERRKRTKTQTINIPKVEDVVVEQTTHSGDKQVSIYDLM